jgi:hypothetical protein
MRIAVDFDDVLYPYHHYLRRRIKRRFGLDLSHDRITTFYYELHPKLQAAGITREQLWKEVQAAWMEADSHAEANLLDPAAPQVLNRLRKQGHTIILCTARLQSALPTLKIFLARHKIKPDSLLLGQEQKTGFDVLIDDFPRHAEENAAAGGHSLLYHCDENSNFDESRHPRIHRVHSWTEVGETIQRIDQRRREAA